MVGPQPQQRSSLSVTSISFTDIPSGRVLSLTIVTAKAEVPSVTKNEGFEKSLKAVSAEVSSSLRISYVAIGSPMAIVEVCVCVWFHVGFHGSTMLYTYLVCLQEIPIHPRTIYQGCLASWAKCV